MALKRLYTALRDSLDPRDRVLPQPASLMSPLPTVPNVSLAQWLGTVKDQGATGSCTAQAGTGILEWHYNRFKSQSLAFSPQFLYRAERIVEGDVTMDGGAQSRTMMKVLCQYGTCLESSDPYNGNTGWQQPTTLAQLAEARGYRMGAYHRVSDLETLKGVLRSGYVSSLAIEVYESFETQLVAETGTVPVPAKSEQFLGGHEVYCYGYDDVRSVLLCRNSWGLDWGAAGDFTLPYGYWSAGYVMDSWCCHFGSPWKLAPSLANLPNQHP